MFKVDNKNTRTTSLTSFWDFYCYLWTHFTRFSSVSIVDFEQVNVSWDNFNRPGHSRLKDKYSSGQKTIETALNRGVLNRGVLNRGVFNRGVLDRGIFKRGVFRTLSNIYYEAFANIVNGFIRAFSYVRSIYFRRSEGSVLRYSGAIMVLGAGRWRTGLIKRRI